MDYVLLILESSKFVSVKGRQFAFPMNKTFNNVGMGDYMLQSKKISNDQELIQSDPISCPQNQKGK